MRGKDPAKAFAGMGPRDTGDFLRFISFIFALTADLAAGLLARISSMKVDWATVLPAFLATHLSDAVVKQKTGVHPNARQRIVILSHS